MGDEALTADDKAALADLKRRAERRGFVSDDERAAMDAGRVPPVGLDRRHVCKRPAFAAIYSIEEHARKDQPPLKQRHLSVSIPAATPPPRDLVVAIALTLGFTMLGLALRPSPEAGWRITHVFEDIP